MRAELMSSSYLMAAAHDVQLTRESRLVEQHVAQTYATQMRDCCRTALVNSANPSRRRASMAGAASLPNVALDSYSWLMEDALIAQPT